MIEVKTLVSSTRLTYVSIFTFLQLFDRFPCTFWSVHTFINQNLESGFNVGILPVGFHDSGEDVCFKWVFRDSTLQTESAVN